MPSGLGLRDMARLGLAKARINMAHECPECGEICYCNGDDDDTEINTDFAIIHCNHYLKCEVLHNGEDD